MTSFLISWVGVINFKAGKWAEKRKKIMKMCPKINSLLFRRDFGSDWFHQER